MPAGRDVAEPATLWLDALVGVGLLVGLPVVVGLDVGVPVVLAVGVGDELGEGLWSAEEEADAVDAGDGEVLSNSRPLTRPYATRDSAISRSRATPRHSSRDRHISFDADSRGPSCQRKAADRRIAEPGG